MKFGDARTGRVSIDVKSAVVQKVGLCVDVYFGIGSKIFFLSRRDVFRNTGSRERDFGLSEIRYVRFQELGGQGPVLDIITKDENIRIGIFRAILLYSSTVNLSGIQVVGGCSSKTGRASCRERV